MDKWLNVTKLGFSTLKKKKECNAKKAKPFAASAALSGKVSDIFHKKYSYTTLHMNCNTF